MADSDGAAPPTVPHQQLLTVYGRKPVHDALADESLDCFSLHLARSNRSGGIVAEIRSRAERRGIPVREHSRESLARISRNGRQDQGVALDILCPAFDTLPGFLATRSADSRTRLLALDGITNPQNVGMIIRSAAAGDIDGIILPRRGNAALGPLVIKASAGTVFRAPLLSCESIGEALAACSAASASICILDGDAEISLFGRDEAAFSVYVLGNETDGVSAAAREQADQRISIPMRNGVESLNVAVAASLIAYLPRYEVHAPT